MFQSSVHTHHNKCSPWPLQASTISVHCSLGVNTMLFAHFSVHTSKLPHQWYLRLAQYNNGTLNVCTPPTQASKECTPDPSISRHTRRNKYAHGGAHQMHNNYTHTPHQIPLNTSHCTPLHTLHIHTAMHMEHMPLQKHHEKWVLALHLHGLAKNAHQTPLLRPILVATSLHTGRTPDAQHLHTPTPDSLRHIPLHTLAHTAYSHSYEHQTHATCKTS